MNQSSTCIACGMPFNKEIKTNAVNSQFCSLCTFNGTIEPDFESLVYVLALKELKEGQQSQELETLLENIKAKITRLPYWQEKTLSNPTLEGLQEVQQLQLLASNMNKLEISEEYFKSPDFFISHSWAGPDEELVEPFVDALKDRGYQVWYDKDTWLTESGEKEEWMKGGIVQARHCIVIISTPYFISEACQYELKTILKTKKREFIFPILWKDITSEVLQQYELGRALLDIVGVGWNDWQGNINVLLNKIITLSNNAEGLQDYNEISLIADEVRVLKQLEAIIQQQIPALDKKTLKSATFGFYAEDHRITALFLENMNLKRLPPTLRQCTALKTLSLKKNSIVDIPTNLITLENLNIEQNQLKMLPENFGNLINLKILNLRTNNLQKLPESFGKLTNLQTLNLGWNQLSELPVNFGDLGVLTYLNLRSNQLKTLPDSFGNLDYLDRLYLMDNQFKELPSSVKKLQDRGCKVNFV